MVSGRWSDRPWCIRRRRGGSELDTDGFPEIYKRIEVHSLLPSSRCAAHPSFSLPPPKLQAWRRCYPSFLTTLHIIMFSKAALTFLVAGALSVNALSAPVPRSPAPEPGCEFPRSFAITSYHDLMSPSTAQELEAWMLKRDLSYELFSREPQALDELFSREPEGWAEWAGSARDYYTAKREPSPGAMFSKTPKPIPPYNPYLPTSPVRSNSFAPEVVQPGFPVNQGVVGFLKEHHS